MATIHDLPNRSIRDMSQPELIDHIMAVRSRRRTVVVVAKKKPSAKRKRNPRDLMGMLSPAQAEEILKQLEEEDEDGNTEL